MANNKITISEALTIAQGYLAHVQVSGYENMQYVIGAMDLINKCIASIAEPEAAPSEPESKTTPVEPERRKTAE